MCAQYKYKVLQEAYEQVLKPYNEAGTASEAEVQRTLNFYSSSRPTLMYIADQYFTIFKNDSTPGPVFHAKDKNQTFTEISQDQIALREFLRDFKYKLHISLGHAEGIKKWVEIMVSAANMVRNPRLAARWAAEVKELDDAPLRPVMQKASDDAQVNLDI